MDLSIIDTSSARLPEVYEAAKTALAECDNVDECKTWSDKAQALASYAKQADDDILHNFAMRIRGRAVKRCGELLKEFDGRGHTLNTIGDHGISQRQAASDAGMSEHQQLQASRVANVPDDEFEEAIESDNPATITKLAEKGKVSRSPFNTKDDVPEGFNEAIHTIGALKRFVEKCEEYSPSLIAGGLVGEKEFKAAISLSDDALVWLEMFNSLVEK